MSPSTEPYSSASGAVDSIAIKQRNVFDPAVPGEDWWPFRMANVLHIRTKQSVIRREILLRQGAPWDPLIALESERNLRATRFIRKAEIRPRPAANGRLDLDVEAQDSWTTLPQINIATEGGERYLSYGIEEMNLLGYGKTASLFHSQIGENLRNEARYIDDRVWGSRLGLAALYATTNRGDEIGAKLGRPFFSLESPYAWNALWTRIIQEDSLYHDGAVSTKFVQNFRSVTASAGQRIGSSRDPVQRVMAGAYYERDSFEPTDDTAPGTLPEGREFSGPIVGYSRTQPRYVKETYIDKMERVEDFNLGNEFSATAGAMMTALGSDRDRWTLNAFDQQGLRLGQGRFLLGQAGVQGRLADGKAESSLFYANLNVFWKTWWKIPQTWVVHLEWNATRNLDKECQLILGGNTGLRGYKVNSFTGTRSLLLNFEDRVFLTREFFHLFHLGGVAFLDTGAVTGRGAFIGWRDLKSDVGFGLRFSPTRSTTGNVLRVDLAYALDRGPGPSRWVVSVRGGQAFRIFNSTNRTVTTSPASALSEESAGTPLRKR